MKLKKLLYVVITTISMALFLFSFNACEAKENEDKENAQKAYELLENAEKLCINGMDDIYGAWYFGIYDADDCTIANVFYQLSLETSFTSTDLQVNGGYVGSYLVNGKDNVSGWQYCLWTVLNCLETRGDYTQVDNYLAQSKACIQKLSSDYSYLSDFKVYYSKVASYAEFFKNPTGSFNQLQTTVSSYENDIRTAKEVFKFDFE